MDESTPLCAPHPALNVATSIWRRVPTVRELNGCRRMNAQSDVARCVSTANPGPGQHIQPACWVSNPRVASEFSSIDLGRVTACCVPSLCWTCPDVRLSVRKTCPAITWMGRPCRCKTGDQRGARQARAYVRRLNGRCRFRHKATATRPFGDKLPTGSVVLGDHLSTLDETG